MTPPRSRIIVAAAVVRRRNEYLVARRPEGVHLAGYWEFPGGKCEPGETFDMCLQREIEEELGVGIRVGAKILQTSHDYPERTVELHFFDCELTGEPSPRLGQQLLWVPREQLGELCFPPADAELIRMLQRCVDSS